MAITASYSASLGMPVFVLLCDRAHASPIAPSLARGGRMGWMGPVTRTMPRSARRTPIQGSGAHDARGRHIEMIQWGRPAITHRVFTCCRSSAADGTAPSPSEIRRASASAKKGSCPAKNACSRADPWTLHKGPRVGCSGPRRGTLLTRSRRFPPGLPAMEMEEARARTECNPPIITVIFTDLGTEQFRRRPEATVEAGQGQNYRLGRYLHWPSHSKKPPARAYLHPEPQWWPLFPRPA